MRLDYQITNLPRQDLRYHNLPVNKINNSLQSLANIGNRELTRLTHASTELKSEVTVKFIGSNPDPIPTCFKIKPRTFPSRFVVNSLHFTSTVESPFNHQWGSTTSYQPFSGLNYQTLEKIRDVLHLISSGSQ